MSVAVPGLAVGRRSRTAWVASGELVQRVEDVLSLPSTGCEVPLSDVYRGALSAPHA